MQEQNELIPTSEGLEQNSKSIFKWLFIFLIILLILSLGLNFYLLLFIKKNINSDKESTTTVETKNIQLTIPEEIDYANGNYKEIKQVIFNDTKWISLQTEKNTDKNFIIWTIDKDNQIKKLNTFNLSTCDSVDWQENHSGGITLNYHTSPCEAFRKTTTYFYDDRGNEALKVTSSSSSSTLKFSKYQGPEYEVTWINSEECEGSEINVSENIFTFGTVEFTGIKVLNEDTENIFKTEEPISVSCEGGYGDTIELPSLKNLDVSLDSSIRYNVTDTLRVIISLNKANFGEVRFFQD